MESHMPTELRTRVRNEYGRIRQLPETANPVKKVPLVVTGEEAEVRIDQIDPEDEENIGNDYTEQPPPNGNNSNAAAGQQGPPLRSDNQMLRALCAQLRTVQALLREVKVENQRLEERLNTRLAQISRNIGRIAQQLVVRALPRGGQAGAEGDNNNIVQQQASLSPNPRTLYLLWGEWENGIGGRKPARDFNSQERGRVKYTFHRQKVFWDKVSEMVRAGWHAMNAIDRIYEVYGRRTSVTSIINRMRSDRRNGGNPGLVVLGPPQGAHPG